MPEMLPMTPEPKLPASNPADWAFWGFTGENTPPQLPSRDGGTTNAIRPTPLVAVYTFAAAAHSPAASSVAVGTPPEAVVSSTLLAWAWMRVPSTASVWIAYCAARSLMTTSSIDGWAKSMSWRDTFTYPP